MKKCIVALLTVLLVIITGCTYESIITSATCDNTVKECDIEISYYEENDTPILQLQEEESAETYYEYTMLTIQDLFEPIDSAIYSEGLPVPARLYPFGEIAGPEVEGRVSYVIFIETCYYYVMLYDNLTRAIPKRSPPEGAPSVLFEITQITNISVAEAVYQIKANFNYYPYPDIFYTSLSEHFLFSDIEFHYGSEWNSKVIRVFIRDNTVGGVFVITSEYFLLATSGHGVRFRHYISTFEIID